MNLKNTLNLYGMGNVAVEARPQGIGHHPTQMRAPKIKNPFMVKADASSSDLASHHLWQEPSSTDVTIRKFRAKTALEKKKGRFMDPFEADAEMAMFGAAEEVTGPCGCTLKLGEKVLVEGRGKGVIMHRSNRVLTVALDGNGSIQIDQRLVHRPQ